MEEAVLVAGACPQSLRNTVWKTLLRINLSCTFCHHSNEDNLRAENWLWVPIQAFPLADSVSLDRVVNFSVPCLF